MSTNEQQEAAQQQNVAVHATVRRVILSRDKMTCCRFWRVMGAAATLVAIFNGNTSCTSSTVAAFVLQTTTRRHCGLRHVFDSHVSYAAGKQEQQEAETNDEKKDDRIVLWNSGV